MKKLICFVVSLTFCALAAASSQQVSVEGRWLTIDDATQKPRSVIELTADSAGVINGFVRQVLDIPGVETNKNCINCKGELKDKPVIGLKVLWQMAAQNNEWTGGKILDPKSGKIYRCRLRLSEDGQQLEVRGFLGIALIGRSQTWHRTAA